MTVPVWWWSWRELALRGLSGSRLLSEEERLRWYELKRLVRNGRSSMALSEAC